MDNRRFFLKFRDYQQLELQTHFRSNGTRREPPIVTVSDLITWFRAVVSPLLDAESPSDITLHLPYSPKWLPRTLKLTDISTKFSRDTTFEIKCREDRIMNEDYVRRMMQEPSTDRIPDLPSVLMSYPRKPKHVQKWDCFVSEVLQHNSQSKKELKEPIDQIIFIPIADGYHAYFHPFARIASMNTSEKWFDHPLINFQIDEGVTHKYASIFHPNMSLTHHSRGYVGPIEIRDTWELPLDLYSSYGHDEVATLAVNQLYTSMCMVGRESGILTTYNVTWFLHRSQECLSDSSVKETLHISEGIPLRSTNPNLLQCIEYFAGTSNNDWMPYDNVFDLPQGDDSYYYDLKLRRELSWGSSCAGLYDYKGKELVLQSCDPDKQPHLQAEFWNEVTTYEVLKDLQGVAIPKLILFGHSGYIQFGVGTSYCGEVPKHLSPEQKERLVKHLDAIHERGIVHGSMNEWNIVVDDKGNPYIIDFGRAVPMESEEARLKERKKLLDCLNQL